MLSVNKKEDDDNINESNDLSNNVKQKEYLEQVGIEYNEIYLSEETGKNSESLPI